MGRAYGSTSARWGGRRSRPSWRVTLATACCARTSVFVQVGPERVAIEVRGEALSVLPGLSGVSVRQVASGPVERLHNGRQDRDPLHATPRDRGSLTLEFAIIAPAVLVLIGLAVVGGRVVRPEVLSSKRRPPRLGKHRSPRPGYGTGPSLVRRTRGVAAARPGLSRVSVDVDVLAFSP